MHACLLRAITNTGFPWPHRTSPMGGETQHPAHGRSLSAPCPPSPCAAITATGIIWSRYATQITPVNYNLLAVNVFMAITGSYQLLRKFT